MVFDHNATLTPQGVQHGILSQMVTHPVIHEDFRFGSFSHFSDRFFGFCTKLFRFCCLLRFAVSVLFRSRFSSKIKSGFRICYWMRQVGIFRFLSGNMRLKRPQPRARLHGFCLWFSVLIKIYFGFAVFYDSLYSFAVSNLP